MQKLFSFFKALFNLIYPNTCITCNKDLPGKEIFVCPACWLDLPKTNYQNEPDNQIEQIFWGRFPIAHATSYFYYAKGSRYQRLIYDMKYNGKKELGYEMGRKFGAELLQTPFTSVDYIIPVPLHKRKLRKRGFNQSEWIARGMGESLNKPVSSDNLFRRANTKTQTKKTRYERWKNVEDVFQLKDASMYSNKHILLVDDILTTGATIESCASTLLKCSDIRISVATLGFASD